MNNCEARLVTSPHANGYKMRYECPCGEATDPSACQRTVAIQKERDRRAAAYPKLVDALRKVITSLGADEFALDKQQRKDMNAFRAVLRKLGEAP